MMGMRQRVVSDAHLQFRSRIVSKLVWAPPEFKSFVLDDTGKRLAMGTPTGRLPDLRQRLRISATGEGAIFTATVVELLPQ